MSDLGVDAVDGASSSGISSPLPASTDPPHSSVEEFMQAMATSNNRSAAEPSQSGGANTPPADQTKASNHDGGGSWLDRGLGMLQAGVGVIEVVGGVVGGVLTSETGVGAVAGGAVALHGLDDIQAGARQAWTGKPTETVTQQVVTSAAQHAGAPPAVAAGIGIGVDIVAGGGVGGAEKAAVKTTEAAVKTTEAAVKTTEAAVKTTEAAVKGGEDAAKLAKDAVNGAKAEHIIKDGKEVSSTSESAGKAARAAEPGKADLDAYRASLGVRGDVDTIAVGRTNVPGLENEVLGGASPKVRKEAGLPDLNKAAPDRPIQSPNPNPQASRHAEEALANDFVAKVEAAHLKPADLDGKTLNIHISYEKGVCSTCMQGLAEGSKAPAGVIKQLSERYPGLTIRITAEGGNAYAGRTAVEIRNGRIIN
jgi:hypothetical protein